MLKKLAAAALVLALAVPAYAAQNGKAPASKPLPATAAAPAVENKAEMLEKKSEKQEMKSDKKAEKMEMKADKKDDKKPGKKDSKKGGKKDK